MLTFFVLREERWREKREERKDISMPWSYSIWSLEMDGR